MKAEREAAFPPARIRRSFGERTRELSEELLEIPYEIFLVCVNEWTLMTW